MGIESTGCPGRAAGTGRPGPLPRAPSRRLCSLCAAAGLAASVVACGNPMSGMRFACDPDAPSTCRAGWVCVPAGPGHSYDGYCSPADLADVGSDGDEAAAGDAPASDALDFRDGAGGPDAADTADQDPDGIPAASCGNQACESPAENCLNCPKDCGCGLTDLCTADGACAPQPKPGNGTCEVGENCENQPEDCACAAGTACQDKACVACASYCQATNQDCGTPAGCACGTCPDGWACSGMNQCYDPRFCGDGKCAGSENCGSCPSDCGCPQGRQCVQSTCIDCAKLCADHGKTCGTYGNCDCGAAPLCHVCNDNVPVPDCACLAFPAAQKQCGEIEGCLLGPLQGNCPEGQECVGYQCLASCGSVCTAKECGWAGDCICDWCIEGDMCIGNACVAGATTPDNHEPDETPEAAKNLGFTTDDDVASARQVTGTIHAAGDVDWYRISVTHTPPGELAVVASLEGMAEDKDLDLVVCFRCAMGGLAGAKLSPDDTVVEVTPSLVNDARCFASMNLWGRREDLSLVPSCSGETEGVASAVYFRVSPAEEYDWATPYTLKFHL